VDIQIADNSDATQLAQVEAFVQKKVCAVALNGVKSGPAAACVSAAYRAGIPVFTVNVIVSPRILSNRDLKLFSIYKALITSGGRVVRWESSFLLIMAKMRSLLSGVVTERVRFLLCSERRDLKMH